MMKDQKFSLQQDRICNNNDFVDTIQIGSLIDTTSDGK